MKKSKIILLFKISLIIIFFIYLFFYYKKDNYSAYNGTENKFYGVISKIEYKEDKIVFYVNAKEKLLVNYYQTNIDFEIGDYIEINGILSLPKNNTNFHLFNYKEYLLSKKIYYILNADNIKKIKDNNKWYYSLKQNLINRIDKLDNYNYLKAFILGDNNDLEMSSYQINGVSHLFAISGMHITLITLFLSKLLLKINKNELLNNILISIFLIIYIFITSFSVSVIRASLMFIFSKINKYLKLNLKTIEILLLIAIILLFINPFYIYSLSFKFSFIVCFYLISFSNLINKRKNYFTKLLMTSFIAFLAGFPIQVNSFYGINLLSIFMNIIFVPIFTFLIFPLGIISFFIPFISFIFEFIIFYF